MTTVFDQRPTATATLPSPPELELAAAYHSVDRGEVGGDFYDVIGTATGWLLVLGDVCGSGAQVAAWSSLARHTVRAAAAADTGPVDVLGALNDTFGCYEPEDSFCTAVCAHLGAETGWGRRMTLASGGHPPPLVRRGDGGVEDVLAAGMPLGLFDDAQLTATEVTLQAGDLMLLYTDGLSEARRGDQLFGVEGLAAVLGSAARLTATALVDKVHTAAGTWQDRQRDDMATLAVELRA